MKKTLIALAVLAASGAAMAQSSVTLYGVADLGLGKTTGDTGVIAQANGGATGVTNNGNSRLGFKGVEDLGGGLKAAFNIEGAVNLANGASQDNTSGLYQRAAWLQLEGGFGALRAGRSLSPSFYAVANYELTGTANYSALVNTFGTGGALRNSAEVVYTTPSLSGFKISAGTILRGNNGGNSKTELAVTYNNGPVAFGASYDKTGTAKNTTIGGSYNLGQFVVAASYHDPAGARKGFTIGGTVKFGANKLTLDVARQTGKGTGVVASTNYLLEAVEPLSKRTFLYQDYLHAKTTAGATLNSWGFGIRHNF